MKYHFTLTLLLFFIASMQAQPYAVGVRTVTYIDSARSSRSVGVEVHYPAAANGNNTAIVNDSFPFVVFGHGFQLTASAYYPFADSLAGRGYIVAFPTTESSLSPSHPDFAQDLIFVYHTLISESSDTASPFYQHVIARGAISGHSMGGGCAVLSAQYSNPAVCYWTLAEATTSPSSITAAPSMTKPYLSLAGSYDCIAPYGSDQEPTYDSSGSPCKILVEITGASHCQFGESDAQCDFGETVSGCASPPLSRAAQIHTALSYIEPYLDFYLKGSATALLELDSVYTADHTDTRRQSCAAIISGIREPDASGMRVYPNPASDRLYIASDVVVKEAIVMDETGRRLLSGQNEIDISGLAVGIYLVRVTAVDERLIVCKVSKK